MRYQKPVVMDLSAGARTSGQWPLGCYNGTTPGGSGYCQFGTGGVSLTDYVCDVGPLPDTAGPAACIIGPNPPSTLCMIGSGGAFEDTCTSGPVPTPG